MNQKFKHCKPGLLLISVLGFCALAILSARMLLGARAEYTRAAAVTDTDQRVRHLRRAMAYYLPGNPWVQDAHHQLLKLAQDAQADQDPARALRVYRELRGAILSLRGLGVPFAKTLDQINPQIAKLAVESPGAAQHLQDERGKNQLLARLKHPDDPHPFWAGLGVMGFLLWAGAAGAAARLGLDQNLKPRLGRLLPLMGLVILGFALYAVGMGLA